MSTFSLKELKCNSKTYLLFLLGNQASLFNSSLIIYYRITSFIFLLIVMFLTISEL